VTARGERCITRDWRCRILATGAGFFAYRATLSDRSVAEAVADLMRLRLPDVSGKDKSLAQWRDKVLIVNFWGRWTAGKRFRYCCESRQDMRRTECKLSASPSIL
jgi:hypothetical protein